MLNTPFSPWPSYSAQEATKAAEVIISNKVNYWTGQEGKNFENEFAKFSNSEYAIAVSNGTVALDLAWLALKISEGDEVIVTSRTYLASASSIVQAGGTPVFADVDLDSQNVTVETVEPLITKNTKAICCVHLAGWPCDMKALRKLATAHGIMLVEDCAQAHGAQIDGQSVGSIGDISAWSFCQDKIMTTAGEGGMVTTNNESYWRTMWEFKDHGKNWDSVHSKNHPPGFRWLHDSIGTNWRMPEVQSAIGRIQLTYMPEWSKRRCEIASSILDVVSGYSCVRAPRPDKSIKHAWYRAYLFVNEEQLKDSWDRDRIMNTLVEKGVPCYSGSCSEVYREKAFTDRNLQPINRLPNAKQLGETSLMFLCHPTLTNDEVDCTKTALIEVLDAAKLNTPQASSNVKSAVV